MRCFPVGVYLEVTESISIHIHMNKLSPGIKETAAYQKLYIRVSEKNTRKFILFIIGYN